MNAVRVCCAIGLIVGSCRGGSPSDEEPPDTPEGGQSNDPGSIGTGGARASGAAGEVSAGGNDLVQGGSGPCDDETRAWPYIPDMTAEGVNGTRVTLLRSTPTPRVGNHSWSLAITDAAGDPVVGATVRVTPFMPEHRHGSPLVAVVQDQGDGAYEAFPRRVHDDRLLANHGEGRH